MRSGKKKKPYEIIFPIVLFANMITNGLLYYFDDGTQILLALALRLLSFLEVAVIAVIVFKYVKKEK